MDILKAIIIFFIGFLASGLMLGASIIISSKIKSDALRWIQPLIFPAVALIPAIAVCICYPTTGGIIQVAHLRDGIVWAVFAVTVLIVSALVTFKKNKDNLTKREILQNAACGMFMEIPQRMMMQLFVYGLLLAFGVSNASILCLVINGLVWCAGIFVQGMMAKEGITSDLVIDMLASFIFSIGIGYTLLRSSCILIAFLAHFCERLLSKYMMRGKCKAANN